MMTSDLISVVIPVYNSERYLEECLDSIISQTYQNIEIIAVDDGSTDSSLDLLKKSDMVISFPSTIIIEGIMAKKPTVLIPLLIDEYGFFHPKFKAITILNNQKWEESINEILLNKNNIRNTLLNNQNNFLKYVISNPGNASEKIIKVIDNLINYNI